MLTLFDTGPVLPEGFSYENDFISEEEENLLTELATNTGLNNMMFHGYEAKRKTANFGYDWSFENRTLTKGKPIPEAFQFLIEKVSKHFNIPVNNIAELLVTEYPMGAVINWHRDAPPYDWIIGISLASDCTFKLRPYDKLKQGRLSVISMTVKRRSVYIMKDAARTEWEHSTSPGKTVRYSITLRTLK